MNKDERIEELEAALILIVNGWNRGQAPESHAYQKRTYYSPAASMVMAEPIVHARKVLGLKD